MTVDVAPEVFELFGLLLGHVPSIYRASGEVALARTGRDLGRKAAWIPRGVSTVPLTLDADDPFTLLVYALSESHWRTERTLALVPERLDPRTAPSALTWPEHGFLELLASWVAIDAEMLGIQSDRELIDAVPLDRDLGPDGNKRQDGGTAAPDQLDADHQAATLRHLVLNAAPLHAARCTPAATRYLLEVLLDADVEILEWRWPTPLQLDFSGTLGVDAMLTGEVPLDRCLTLLLDSPSIREAIAWARAGRPGLTVTELSLGDRAVGTIIKASVGERPGSDGAGHDVAKPGASGTQNMSDAPIDPLQTMLQEKLRRLHAVLKHELPAHLMSYVGFKPYNTRPPLDVLPYVVQVNSTIGRFQIQRKL